MSERSVILVVDNEHDFAQTLKDQLEGKGHQVWVAADGEQARQLANLSVPDAVVLGTITPRGAPFQLQQWFKNASRLKDVPLVVVDVPPERQLTRGWSRDEGMRMEAVEYFQKPVRASAIMSVIEKALDVRTDRIRVLVADDHAVVRDGIRALLNLQRDIAIVGEAVDGREAVEKALSLSPDVVLMDIVMPHMNGLEATRRITSRTRKSRVLMLSQYDDDENVEASGKVGALGFISKRDAGSRLVKAIRAAGQGQSVSSPA